MSKKKILAGFIGLMFLSGAAYADEQVERRWWCGVYVGFGIGQTVLIDGGMTANSSFQNNGSTPVQFSAGRAINNNLRIEVSYLAYSGIFLGGSNGGDILSDVAMLSVYHNLDPYIGSFFGGKLRPYLGASIGIGFNQITHHLTFDGNFYGKSTQSLAYAFEGGFTTELDNGLSFDFF